MMFGQYGTVLTCKLMRDQHNGVSKRAALLSFSSVTEADDAIRGLNACTIPGTSTPLVVKYAAYRPGTGTPPSGAQQATIIGPQLPPSLEQCHQLPPSPTQQEVDSFQLQQQLSLQQQQQQQMCNNTQQPPLMIPPSFHQQMFNNNTTPPQTTAFNNNNPSSMMMMMPQQQQQNTSIIPPAIPQMSQMSFPMSMSQLQCLGYGGAAGAGAPAMMCPTPMMQAPTPNLPADYMCNLWIGNLPKDYTETELNVIFGAIGVVRSCVVMRDKFTNMSRGAALVKYTSFADANSAIQILNGLEIDKDTPPLIVRFADTASSPS
jgi:RNA recognition motif-containing protein